MDFYGIEMKGSFNLEILNNIPDFKDSDTGRLIYVNSSQLFFYGGQTNWILAGENLSATLEQTINGVVDNRYISPLKLNQVKSSVNDVLIGSDEVKYITPFALRGLKASIAEAHAGVNDIKYVTPAGLTNSITTFFQDNPGIIPGTIILYASNTPPSGYLKANGAAVSRTTYSSLFNKIGTIFGNGNGSTTFNLPDLRGEFIRGWSDGHSVDSGRAFGSKQDEQTNNLAFVEGTDYSGPQNVPIAVPNTGAWSSWIDSGDGGGGASMRFRVRGVETRPRNIALLACIKY